MIECCAVMMPALIDWIDENRRGRRRSQYESWKLSWICLFETSTLVMSFYYTDYNHKSSRKFGAGAARLT